MWHVQAVSCYPALELFDGIRTTLFLLPGAELLVIFNFVSVTRRYRARRLLPSP